MSRDFQGLIAVISGAGSGIGLAVAKKFSAQGAKVFGLDLSAGELENDGAGTWIECDIGSDESVKLAFESIASQVSKIDVLINNAGIGAQGGDIVSAVRAGRNDEGTGLIINSSRAVLYASNGVDFAQASRAVAIDTRDAIRAANN